jgi:uncharacterized protein YdeI (YjbR/CyaY-like superfamily)
VEHATAAGVWLKIAKKDSGIASVDYAQGLEVALCWGWIDGQRGRFDDRYFLTRFTPRTTKSRWSQRNCTIAEELIATGAMRPPGLAQVELAKADGRWEAAYPSQANATVPDDLQLALDANPAALAFFDTLDSINRYAFLYRLHHVSRPDARSARITRYVEMLARGETLHG